MKKILIIGCGGREHALGYKISQDSKVDTVYYAPGNAGTQEGKGKNIPIDGSKKENFEKIHDFIKENEIDMTIVGPEVPLSDGIVDFLNEKGYNRVFGPTKSASRLEGDKFYSYDIMKSANIPQAESVQCSTTDEAIAAIKETSTEDGVVIKARGLTAGKGVSVCDTEDDALREITEHADNFGPEVLIAQRFYGQEFSIFGISDGNKVYPINCSFQDHKPLLEDDKGPNTGGMGAYGPAPIASEDVVKKVADEIMTPVVQKMKEEGNEFKGFLYAGMISTEEGLRVIEFNARFGDPECQPAMMMIKTSLYDILDLALEGKLDQMEIEFNPGAACCVVMASNGYPKKYEKGLKITGLNEANQVEGVKVFHAGTKMNDSGQIVNNGGRVLGVTGYSKEGLSQAQKIAYNAVFKINIPGEFSFRKDIGNKALK